MSEEEEIPDEVYLAAVLNFGRKFSAPTMNYIN